MNKEEFIFELYKDDSIGAKKFRAVVKNKYKMDDKTITDLYVKINNYQIKKYGERLHKGSDIQYETSEDYKRKAHNMRVLKYHKLKNKGKEI